jgi:ATP-dependent Clp protease adaptor protein ClpS
VAYFPNHRICKASANSPGVQSSGADTEVLDRPEVETDTDADLQSPWNVIVYNDPVNLMPYVTMVFQRVFGYPEAKATQMMLDVHQKGKCVVWSGEREKAEYYVQQLQSHQLQATMKKAS